MNQKTKMLLAAILAVSMLFGGVLTGCREVQPVATTETTEPAGIETEPAADTTEPTRQDGVYFITVLPSAHGTVTADRTEAKAGETVTLTVTAEEGYELSSLTVNGADCEEVFTMPAEDVNVLARFALIAEETEPAKPVVVYPNGTFFGSVGNIHSSTALNMKTDKGDAPYLVMDANKATPLYAYVKGLNAEQFGIAMQVRVTGIRKDEGFPKFGLMTNDGKEMVKFYLDMTTEKQVGSVGAVHQQSGKGDDWAGQTTWPLQNPLNMESDSVMLTLLRDGSMFYYYIDGQLVATGSELSDQKAAVGVFSFGTSLKITDYAVITEGEELEQAMAMAQAEAESFNGVRLTQSFFTQEGAGYTLTTDSDAQHLVDDVLWCGRTMRERYYSLTGKLTLTNAGAWGQARVLISGDPNNEYVIALEKMEQDAYQIFTMSKANEEGWNNWTLIDHHEQNGTRNSLNFEIIVSGDVLYFLVDDAVYYTSRQVAMTESTVKFTGYNVATTTVENLSLQIFEDAAAADAYAASKADRFGDTFFESQGSYWTSNGVDLSADSGEAPAVKITGGAPQYAYLNDVFADKFSFETRFHVESVLNNDSYPKFGILANGSSEMLKFFVDMNVSMTATHVGLVYQPANGGDDWANSVSVNVPGMAFTGSNWVTMKLIRDGSAYYLYVNDALVLYDEEGFKDEKTAVGIFSFNTKLTANGYSILIGSAADDSIATAKTQVETLNKLGLTCNWFADNGNGRFTLTTDSNAEHKVDDLTKGGMTLRAAYYAVKGKLTLTNAGDWGQARILVSADAQNEYFIALERTSAGKYQVFTMSKATQTGWDRWELILHEDVNGTRNSLDFELVVIGNRMYFFIEGQQVYTSQRVNMSASTVKFTGYNVGTTTVENLSAQVFKNQQAAEEYLSQLTG